MADKRNIEEELDELNPSNIKDAKSLQYYIVELTRSIIRFVDDDYQELQSRIKKWGGIIFIILVILGIIISLYFTGTTKNSKYLESHQAEIEKINKNHAKDLDEIKIKYVDEIKNLKAAHELRLKRFASLTKEAREIFLVNWSNRTLRKKARDKLKEVEYGISEYIKTSENN